MKKVKFYVVVLRKGKEVNRYFVGNAMQDEKGLISCRTYDKFKRLAAHFVMIERNKTNFTKSFHFKITNEFDDVDTFGGYPAYGFLPLGVQFKRKDDVN